MGAKGARRSMGTKAARRTILSTLHPNSILKPNLDRSTHPNPQPGPIPTPTPTPRPSRRPSPNPSPNPNQDWILGPSWWGKEHCLGDFNDTTNEVRTGKWMTAAQRGLKMS